MPICCGVSEPQEEEECEENESDVADARTRSNGLRLQNHVASSTLQQVSGAVTAGEAPTSSVGRVSGSVGAPRSGSVRPEAPFLSEKLPSERYNARRKGLSTDAADLDGLEKVFRDFDDVFGL